MDTFQQLFMFQNQRISQLLFENQMLVQENQRLIQENQQLYKHLEESTKYEVAIEVVIEEFKNELSKAAEEHNIFSTKDFDYLCANYQLAVSSIFSNCPKLMQLINSLTSNNNVSISIFNQILYCFSERANALCFLLGFYLISVGAGKKLLSITHKLGLTPHYVTIWKALKKRRDEQASKFEQYFKTQQGHFIVDNINLRFESRFFRSSNLIENQWNGTAALVFFTPPANNFNVESDSDLFITEDDISQLFRFYSNVLKNLEMKRTGIGKRVDKAKLFSLPLIDQDCGKTEGCRNVLLDLLKISKEKKTIVFGDVGFVLKARGAQREVQSEDEFTNLKTFSLIFGDFHAFMEEQLIIKKHFWGEKEEFFSLSYICKLLDRNIQQEKKQFHHTDELFLHILLALRRFYCDISEDQLVEKFQKQNDYLSSLGWNMLNYWAYRFAVRGQNTPMLKIILKNQFLRYLGAECKNYVTETFSVFQETPTQAFTERTLNLIGVQNHGIAVDLVMEKYIGYIKNTLKLANTKIEKLQTVTANFDLLEMCEEAINGIYDIKYNRSYSVPDYEQDVEKLVNCLKQNEHTFPTGVNFEAKGLEKYFSWLSSK